MVTKMADDTKSLMDDNETLAQFAWMEDKPRAPLLKREVKPYPTTTATIDRVKAKPLKWARVSCHVSQGAARIKRGRWVKMLKRWEESGFELMIEEMYPGSETPWVVMMRYAPESLKDPRKANART